MTTYAPATAPTLYFIGVTTGQSSIMKVFPAWAKELGLEGSVIKGIDFPLHADPDAYREAVEFIRNDPLSLGALVTTHKIDLYAACCGLFDIIDEHALFMGETSCLSKQGNKLVCHAKDPISSGLALDAFLQPGYFADTGAALFAMGAGGSTIALSWHLLRRERGADMPQRVIISNRSQPRLDAIRRIHQELRITVPAQYVLAPKAEDNDRIMATLAPGSLVINATGLGKDAPGSPITDAGLFPERGIAWDLNYRGNLIFLDQARRQQEKRKLQVEDGWIYFIHGWTQVLAEVFHIDIPTSGPRFDVLAEIAARAARS